MARRSRRQSILPESGYVIETDHYRQEDNAPSSYVYRINIGLEGMRLLQEAILQAYNFRIGRTWNPIEIEAGRNLVTRMDEYQRQYNLVMAQLHSYIQRDLEDQIAEEHQQRQQMSENTQQGSSSTPRSERPKVKISEVVSLLSQGYTRYEKDNKGFGSIQQKFGLTHSQTQQLFMHEGLKGLKTRTPSIEIIDDRPRSIPANPEVVRSSSTLVSTPSSSTTTNTTTTSPFD